MVLTEEEQLALVPDFTLDEATAALFGGARLTSYTLPWSDIDANLLAVEYDDFAQAIFINREPEVSGQDGLRSLALMYGFLESERLERFMHIEELLSPEPLPYQQEVLAARKAH